MYSDNFRGKFYHKLDDEQIQQIVALPQDCWFTTGVITGQGRKAILSLSNNALVVQLTDGGKEEVSISEIKKAEITDVGWLAVYPNTAKSFAISNDGRWGIFFGTTFWEKLYGLNLPFVWQPHSREVRAADRIAIAFLFKLKQLQQNTDTQ
jgi:hypothetical protein